LAPERQLLGAMGEGKYLLDARIALVVGLDMTILVVVLGSLFTAVKGLLMSNASVVVVCVWCGVAFL
jgi:hypothetical protein